MRRIFSFVLVSCFAVPSYAQDVTPEAAVEENADEWARPRILLVRGRRVANATLRKVSDVLRSVGEVVDGDSFSRSARQRGLPPTAGSTFEQLLADEGVALAVVLAPGSGGTLSVTYREGTSGFVLLEEEHAIAGRISERMAERIQAEARLAMAVVTRPTAEQRARAAETPVAPGAVFGLSIGVAAGVGTRESRLPNSAVGRLDLDTGIFAAAGLDLEVGVKPSADARTRIFGRVRYATSLGLRIELSALGADQDAAARSQHFDVGLGVDWRLTDANTSAAFLVGLGWAMRRLSTEGETLLPDYGLSGPRLDLGVRVPFFDGRIELRLLSELQLLVVTDDPLKDQGVGGAGIAYGGYGQIAVLVTDTFAITATYRESHARMDGVRDVERWVLLQFGYAP